MKQPSLSAITRRGFVRSAALASAALAGTRLRAAEPLTVSNPLLTTALEGSLPQGKIGSLSFSRLIFGGNITNAWMHARDLNYVSALARHYNTDEKIDETFRFAESRGIDTAVGGVNYMIRHMRRYRERCGGKMKLICWFNLENKSPDRLRDGVRGYVDQGVSALFFNGAAADALLSREGEAALEAIATAAEIVRACGVPFGMAAHDLRTLELCEKHPGVAPDFYFKTFHHHSYPTAPKPEEVKRPDAEIPGYWCSDPEAVIQFMQNTRKPWIAFKVLAAGAIPPKNAFRYAFHHGADFICVGMFDFQVEENCRLVAQAIQSARQRPRPWCA
jgi:hypothetical protein